jgi:hypothetical protein
MRAQTIAIVAVVCLALFGAAMFAVISLNKPPQVAAPLPQIATSTSPVYKVIGTSVQGRKIESYTYGTGPTHVVFVGGIHGGYEWNSVLVAYNLKDYLDANPDAVSTNESITVILDANPDGVFKVVGKEGRFAVADVPTGDISYGRFNANKVDLNRNFDCNWSPTGTWQNKTVSAGTAPFSEPEAAAIRDYALQNKPTAFVFWHSAAGGVYASQCKKGILPKTLEIMNTYAQAAGYSAIKSFNAYPVNGASEDWLASVGIPAITVELKTHNAVEWDQNLAGIKALLADLAK